MVRDEMSDLFSHFSPSIGQPTFSLYRAARSMR